MNTLQLWTIETEHTNPGNFYVTIDGSASYFAIWLVRAGTKDRASEVALEISSELQLGSAVLLRASPYDSDEGKKADFSENLQITLESLEKAEGGLLSVWTNDKGVLL